VLSVVRWRRFLDDTAYALLPLVTFFGAAIVARLNIGERHILPIHPFALLLAGYAIAELCAEPRKPFRALLGALGLLAVIEFAIVCPHYLAFFNQFTAGPRNGHKYLLDSNIDWGQDLKGLKRWMDGRDVRHINLSYFGTADPAYYKIDCAYLPGGPFFDEKFVRRPALTGLCCRECDQPARRLSSRKRSRPLQAAAGPGADRGDWLLDLRVLGRPSVVEMTTAGRRLTRSGRLLPDR